MENKFTDWAKKKYTLKQRIYILIPAGFVFVLLVPGLFILASRLDAVLGIPQLLFEPLNLIITLVIIVLGSVFALWSINIEFRLGEGTPVPIAPTRKLIVSGPFSYCRNPMVFGTVCVYLGIVVFMGSLSAFILFLIFTTVLLLYVKRVEEKELELRFGDDYISYKQSVPFLFPRIKKKYKK